MMNESRRREALRLALMTPDELVQDGNEPRTDIRSYEDDTEVVAGHERTLEAILKRYFSALKDTIPYKRIEQLFESPEESDRTRTLRQDAPNALSESENDELNETFAEWLEGQHDLIEDRLASSLAETAFAGFRPVFETHMEKFGLDFEPTPWMMATLQRSAERRAEWLMSWLDRMIMKRIADAIADTAIEKTIVEAVLKAIQTVLNFLITEEARMYAREEAESAFSYGKWQAYKEFGATHKKWLTEDDGAVCGVCRENEAEGLVPIDFLYGWLAFPPAHPRCRCRMEYFGVTRESVLEAFRPPT